MDTKQQILKGNVGRYLKASKKEKGQMLDEWTQLLSMHRKAIIRRLQQLQRRDARVVPRQRGQRERYGPSVTAALTELWNISSELCGERLHPMVKEYVGILERDKMWHHATDTTQLLLRMSLSTIKRRIARFRSYRRKQRQQTTKAGHIITLIPLRTGPWKNPPPGYGEIDTVVHCGDTLAGDMAYTVNYTDITTTWWEGGAQLNKGQKRTQETIADIEQRLPFPLHGLDPDNGSEFINWHLKDWCESHTPQVELTRSRPYRKNDNAHIEQKNGAITRRFVGYRRIDTEKQIALLNELYAGPLRLYVNFFQPSMKLLNKERMGARYKRAYDTPKTPYTRSMGLDSVDQATKNQLSALYATLNPLKLKAEIDRLIHKIFTLKQH